MKARYTHPQIKLLIYMIKLSCMLDARVADTPITVQHIAQDRGKQPTKQPFRHPCGFCQRRQEGLLHPDIQLKTCYHARAAPAPSSHGSFSAVGSSELRRFCSAHGEGCEAFQRLTARTRRAIDSHSTMTNHAHSRRAPKAMSSLFLTFTATKNLAGKR